MRTAGTAFFGRDHRSLAIPLLFVRDRISIADRYYVMYAEFCMQNIFDLKHLSMTVSPMPEIPFEQSAAAGTSPV